MKGLFQRLFPRAVPVCQCLTPVSVAPSPCLVVHNRKCPTAGLADGRVNRLPLGSLRLRRHRDDSLRAWVKVAEPNVWRPRAVVVWELAHGPLPVGHIVLVRGVRPLTTRSSR